jgi:hypothetical protein
MHLPSMKDGIRVRVKSKGGIQSLGLPQKGSASSGTGTRRTGVDGRTYLVHRLVALAFVGPPPSPSHTVDHINRNPDDNRVANLRWATKSEQTLNQNKRTVQRSARPVILESPEGDTYEYDSAWAAAIAIGANAGNISNSAKYGWSVSGYKASYKTTEDQGGIVVGGEKERWKATSLDSNLLVSTMGRIQWRHHKGRMGPRKTPVPNKRLAGYCFVRVGNKDMLIHRLIIETFMGKPDDVEKNTVDHMNHIRHDSRLSNLRWASTSEQRSNQSRSVINVDEIEVAPNNINLAERKRYYSRVGMDGVWMVRMQCPGKRRWARAKCVIVGSEAGEESGVQKTGTLHTAPNKTEGGQPSQTHEGQSIKATWESRKTDLSNGTITSEIKPYERGTKRHVSDVLEEAQMHSAKRTASQ